MTCWWNCLTNDEVILASPEEVADHRCRFWADAEIAKLRARCKRLEHEVDIATGKRKRRVQ